MGCTQADAKAHRHTAGCWCRWCRSEAPRLGWGAKRKGCADAHKLLEVEVLPEDLVAQNLDPVFRERVSCQVYADQVLVDPVVPAHHLYVLRSGGEGRRAGRLARGFGHIPCAAASEGLGKGNTAARRQRIRATYLCRDAFVLKLGAVDPGASYGVVHVAFAHLQQRLLCDRCVSAIRRGYFVTQGLCRS